MDIYSFQKVHDYLFSLDLGDVYHSKREFYIKNHHPSEYQIINDYTENMKIKSFTEKLFCYCNKITEIPKCRMCDKKVTYSFAKKTYNTYCSQTCAMYDMKTLIGVENSSQLESVKEKRKESYLNRYGTEHFSKSEEHRKLRSKQKKEYWEKYRKTKVYSQDLLFEQYYHRVAKYSNVQYKKYKHILDPDNKRGKNWHLDHIYSISQAHINNVPIEIVGDVTNLRLIPAMDNLKKGLKCDKTLESLYEDFYKSNTRKDL